MTGLSRQLGTLSERTPDKLAGVALTDAVIPVAGLGTRLLPATRSQPKEMLPIIDRPVVQYVVEELVAGGITRILFVTGRRKRAIEDHFDADPELGAGPLIDPRSGLQIFYIRQAEPAGLGDALRYANGFSTDSGVVVALGDAIIESGVDGVGDADGGGDTDATDDAGANQDASTSEGTDAQGGKLSGGRRGAGGLVERLVDAYERTGACAAVAVREVPASEVRRYGIVVGETADGMIEVTDMLEKPDPAEVGSRLAVSGRYVLSAKVLSELRTTPPDDSGEVQVADAIRALLDRGERVVAVPLLQSERRHDIGTPESYAATYLRYALRDPRFGAGLRALATELLADE